MEEAGRKARWKDVDYAALKQACDGLIREHGAGIGSLSTASGSSVRPLWDGGKRMDPVDLPAVVRSLHPLSVSVYSNVVAIRLVGNVHKRWEGVLVYPQATPSKLSSNETSLSEGVIQCR